MIVNFRARPERIRISAMSASQNTLLAARRAGSHCLGWIGLCRKTRILSRSRGFQPARGLAQTKVCGSLGVFRQSLMFHA